MLLEHCPRHAASWLICAAFALTTLFVCVATALLTVPAAGVEHGSLQTTPSRACLLPAARMLLTLPVLRQVDNKAAFRIGPAVLTFTGRLARSISLALRVPSFLLSLIAFKAQQVQFSSPSSVPASLRCLMLISSSRQST